MDDDDRIAEDRALRLQLVLHLDRQPINGRLRPERGAEEAFVGWLGFAEALKRLHERHEPPAGPPREHATGDAAGT